MRWQLSLCVWVFACVLSAGNLDARQHPTASQVNPANNSYVLGPDDQISVWALGIPEISQHTVRIDPNGNIDLPMLGSVHAGGRTTQQLRDDLVNRLKEYVQQPEVTISISEFKSQPVSVIGDVNEPGVHQITGPKNLIEVLSLAGGLLPDAGNSIHITRSLEFGRIPLPTAKDDPTGKFSVAEINVKDLLHASHPAENIIILPHDIISVPRAEIVYVMGEVNRPGGYPLTERASYSVLQALSMAGGVTRSAAPKHAEILRTATGHSSRETLALNVSDILAGKATDVPLQPDDILFIPNNVAKSAGLRALEAAIQVGTGVIIWR